MDDGDYWSLGTNPDCKDYHSNIILSKLANSQFLWVCVFESLGVARKLSFAITKLPKPVPHLLPHEAVTGHHAPYGSTQTPHSKYLEIRDYPPQIARHVHIH